MQSNSKKTGFTLMEILVVVAIMALMAGLVLASFGRMRTQQALNGATEEVLAALNQARTKTLAAEGDDRWGVHFASTTVTLFKGSAYSSTAADNRVINLNGAVVASLDLEGGAQTVVFDRLTGATTQAGTITIASIADPTRSRTISIRVAGASGVN